MAKTVDDMRIRVGASKKGAATMRRMMAARAALRRTTIVETITEPVSDQTQQNHTPPKESAD